MSEEKKVDSHDLAKRVADRIFSTGNEPDDKCQRLQFMGGEYPGNETNLGGLCKKALVRVIEAAVSDYHYALLQKEKAP